STELWNTSLPEMLRPLTAQYERELAAAILSDVGLLPVARKAVSALRDVLRKLYGPREALSVFFPDAPWADATTSFPFLLTAGSLHGLVTAFADAAFGKAPNSLIATVERSRALDNLTALGDSGLDVPALRRYRGFGGGTARLLAAASWVGLGS